MLGAALNKGYAWSCVKIKSYAWSCVR